MKIEVKSKKKMAEESKIFRNGYHTLENLVRETEKAAAISISFETVHTEKIIRRLLWLPKSLLKDARAPGWFLLKKVDEIAEEIEETARQPVMVCEVDCPALNEYLTSSERTLW